MEVIDIDKLIKRISEALKPLIKALKEKWDQFKSLVWPQEEYRKKKKENNHLRSTWIVPADTRLKSQVNDNKPRNIVRKVIR
ncbi:MAG: hypothetical protein ACQEXB_18520 [Bacillota bacterium]